nr:multidrug effflux MFS transporter [Saccharibacillus alkalitolerans]
MSLGPAQRLKFVLILGALSAFGPLSIDMYLPALPTLAQNLGTTQSLAQLSLTACLFGLALGQLVAGPLSDVRGRRGPLIAALVLYTLASLACVFAPSAWFLILFRFIQGAAGAAGIVISRAVVRDLFSGTELTRFFTLLMLVNGLAPILAPVLGGFILKYVSWRGIFSVLCAIGGLMLIAVALALPETLEKKRRSSGGLGQTIGTFGQLLRNRSFVGYAFSQAFVTAGMFAYISGSPFVIQDLFGVSPQGFSLFFAVNGLGIVLFSQITGRLVQRTGETRLLVTGLLIAFCAGLSLTAAAWFGGGLVVLAPLMFLIVSSVGMVASTTTALAMQSQEPRTAGSASALIGLMPLLLGAAAGSLVGLGGGGTAFPMGLVIGCAETLALASYLLLVLPARKQPLNKG